MTGWSFLTSHARVPLCIADQPGARLRDSAVRTSVTERTADGIVTDLTQTGYVVKHDEAAATAARSRIWPYSVMASGPTGAMSLV